MLVCALPSVAAALMLLGAQATTTIPQPLVIAAAVQAQFWVREVMDNRLSQCTLLTGWPVDGRFSTAAAVQRVVRMCWGSYSASASAVGCVLLSSACNESGLGGGLLLNLDWLGMLCCNLQSYLQALDSNAAS